MSDWNAAYTAGYTSVRVGDGGAMEVLIALEDTSTVGDAYAAMETSPAYEGDGEYDPDLLLSDDPYWMEVVTPVTSNLYGVVYGTAGAEGAWVAVGEAGQIISRYTGVEYSWVTAVSGTANNLNAITTGNGLFVAVGDGGVILTSDDAITWTAVESGTTADLYGVLLDGSTYIIVGNDETLLVGTMTSDNLRVALVEFTSYGDVVSAGGSSYSVTVEEDLLLDETPAQSAYEFIDDAVEVNDGMPVADVQFAGDASDVLALSQRLFDSYEVVRNTLQIAEDVWPGLHFPVTEAVAVSGVFEVLAEYNAIVEEILEVDDALQNSVLFSVIMEDTAGVSTEATPNQIISEALWDTLFASVSFEHGGEEYTGVVLNVATKAETEYEGFDYNSLCEYRGKYYGAKADGIYLLEGDTDAGAAINARVKLGIDRYGTSAKKRMPEVLLGLRNDGNMVLKVNAGDESGKLVQTWYELTHSNPSLMQHRVKLGRGLSAVYWQFELTNKDGSDFELEHITFYPIAATRRT